MLKYLDDRPEPEGVENSGIAFDWTLVVTNGSC